MVQLVVKSLKLPGDLSGCSRNKSNISQLVWAIANLPTDLLRLHADWAGPVHRVPPVVLATVLASSFLVHGTGHWTGRNLRTSISTHTSMTILQKRLLFYNCLIFFDWLACIENVLWPFVSLLENVKKMRTFYYYFLLVWNISIFVRSKPLYVEK